MTDLTIPPIQLVGPLPPLRTGIAQYTEDLLLAVDGRWPVRVRAEPGSRPFTGESVLTASARTSLDPAAPAVLQVGNSANHPRAYEAANRARGILVLHDVVLHHACLADYITRGKSREYLAELERLYGADGRAVGRAILTGGIPQDLIDFPMFEPFVERARLTIVHNEFARDQVLSRVPGALVERVPMGIPLPALVDQAEARRALGLPSSAFIVASITHINPMKRLPVVLRAFRQVAVRFPEALFVIAGSPSPEVNLQLQTRVLGLEDRVLLLGYVSDVEARLLARASDACVNLRYPATGESSASLLRLLGAERPVLVTDGVSSSELPTDVGLRVPVDRFEEEMIAQLLIELAGNDGIRQDAGAAARRFVEDQHSMGQAVEGYRRAMRKAYGIELPPPVDPAPREPDPVVDAPDIPVVDTRRSALDQVVADALVDLGLDRREGSVRQVAGVMANLGLHRLRPGVRDSTPPGDMDSRLVERLICPVCGGRLVHQDDLVCAACGGRFPLRNGIVDLIETVHNE